MVTKLCRSDGLTNLASIRCGLMSFKEYLEALFISETYSALLSRKEQSSYSTFLCRVKYVCKVLQ